MAKTRATVSASQAVQAARAAKRADRAPDEAAEPVSSPAVDSFLARIGADFESLSRQLKQIARYVEQHRDHIALERIQDVAARCDVQPSAVIRFAKHFGYSGWSE